MIHFDVAVLGKGPIGSAAARHLAKAGLQVVLIGPDEPENLSLHQGVFASHYDQARITRTIDPDPVWQKLAITSIKRHREVEQQSGVSFYHETGHLSAGLASGNTQSMLARIESANQANGRTHERLSAAQLKAKYPQLRLPENYEGFAEDEDGGFVNPRAFVEAQTKLAKLSGAVLLREYATSVSQKKQHVEIETCAGSTVEASRAIVACGCHTTWLLKLRQLKVQGRTTVLLQLSDSEAARLAVMPSIIFEGQTEGDSCYILPPTKYPDGATYIKIGGGAYDEPLESPEAVQDWFHDKRKQKNTGELLSQLQSIVPLSYMTGITKNCVLTFTDSGYPIIDHYEGERIVIASGGNGGAAKSADEIGRLAAGLANGAWFTLLDRKLFALRS